MFDNSEVIRQFAAEGATHLYSSLPSVLTPADLYRVKDDPAYRALIAGSNIYLVVRRRRIYLDSHGFHLDGRTVSGFFLVPRIDGYLRVPFSHEISAASVATDEPIEEVAIAVNGTAMIVTTQSRVVIVAAHVLIANALSTLEPEDTDMDVLYAGQSLGKTGQRTAIDRLLAHTTLQRILAESSTHMPECEILLLLYRFEHGRTMISNAGDFNVESLASRAEESVHVDRLRNVQLKRNEVVSLSEAALINHFKPHYNMLLKSTNFAARSKLTVIKKLLEKGITGLMVEICSSNLRARLGTAHALPLDLEEVMGREILDGLKISDEYTRQGWKDEVNRMAHTHYARYPLTTVQERETFLHGMVWNGETERHPMWPPHGKSSAE